MSISPSTRNEESGFDEDGSKRRGKSTTTSNFRSVKRAKFSSALADALDKMSLNVARFNKDNLLYDSDDEFGEILLYFARSANDAQILLECATNPDYGFPMPPQGKYYLVDYGYTDMSDFLSPYQGERTNAEANVYFDGGEENFEVQATTLQSTNGTLTDNVEFSISRTHIHEMAHVRDEIADHIWRAS
ncbi:uncharacterized protein LOC133795531 [Humulus lupulus]|uniref:uncharacterized protein LOC133795531 n=1 Tax=Humulus lupulus TaxID=3486 RepID=UPI002B415E4B|nr:uncharacterized protein LOC133795531 [Humulus lupulus]